MVTWKGVQKQLKTAQRHARQAEKTASMAMDFVLGEQKKAKKHRGRCK